MKASALISAVAIVALTAGSALAAPCSTSSTKDKSPNEQATNQKSSDVDQSSKNLAGGQQPASPGTVGAMNNAGANQQVGQKGGSDKNDQGSGVNTSSKNLAGGEQPAAPGTVGAMNSAGADQKLGKDDNC